MKDGLRMNERLVDVKAGMRMNERLVDVKAGMRMIERLSKRWEPGKVRRGWSLGSRGQNS